jgi:hypothetical protein
MNRDDVLRWAKEADLWMTSDERIAAVERFAGLVDQKACQREHQWMSAVLGRFSISEETVEFIRDVIRARGEK